jgi:hypothetical protein
VRDISRQQRTGTAKTFLNAIDAAAAELFEWRFWELVRANNCASASPQRQVECGHAPLSAVAGFTERMFWPNPPETPRGQPTKKRNTDRD